MLFKDKSIEHVKDKVNTYLERLAHLNQAYTSLSYLNKETKDPIFNEYMKLLLPELEDKKQVLENYYEKYLISLLVFTFSHIEKKELLGIKESKGFLKRNIKQSYTMSGEMGILISKMLKIADNYTLDLLTEKSKENELHSDLKLKIFLERLDSYYRNKAPENALTDMFNNYLKKEYVPSKKETNVKSNDDYIDTSMISNTDDNIPPYDSYPPPDFNNIPLDENDFVYTEESKASAVDNNVSNTDNVEAKEIIKENIIKLKWVRLPGFNPVDNSLTEKALFIFDDFIQRDLFDIIKGAWQGSFMKNDKKVSVYDYSVVKSLVNSGVIVNIEGLIIKEDRELKAILSDGIAQNNVHLNILIENLSSHKKDSPEEKIDKMFGQYKEDLTYRRKFNDDILILPSGINNEINITQKKYKIVEYLTEAGHYLPIIKTRELLKNVSQETLEKVVSEYKNNSLDREMIEEQWVNGFNENDFTPKRKKNTYS